MSGSEWIDLLWRTSWQGSLFVVAVWLVCRIPRLPASWRCWLWWVACLRLLMGLLNLPALPLPLLAAPASMPPESSPPVLFEPFPGVAENRSTPLIRHMPPPALPHLDPAALLLAFWATGVVVQLGAGTRTLLRIRRLRQAAQPVEAGRVREMVAALGAAAGLRRTLPVLVSPAVRAPMLVGPLAPALLLPSAAVDHYDDTELRMALAHEIIHLRRGDLWLSLVPGLAQALFFFHPLAWVAAREWAVAREAACDAETLKLTAARPADYGRFLLRLADSGPVPAGALHATPAYRTLERRLKMLGDAALNSPNAARSRRLRCAGTVVAVLLCVGFLPWQVTARAAPAKPAAPEARTTPPASRPEAIQTTNPKGDAEVQARYQALIRKLEASHARQLEAFQKQQAQRSRAELQRMLARWEERDRRGREQALAMYRAILRREMAKLAAEAARVGDASRPSAETLRRVNEFYAPSEFPAEKQPRSLLERDPATGELRVTKPGPTITGKLPVPGALTEVTVRGNTLFPRETLLKLMKTRVGEPFSKTSLSDDLRAISRLYQDEGYMVHFDTEGPVNGKIVLILRELAVGVVKFKWEHPESEKHAKAVQDALTLKAGSLYNTKTLQKDFAAVRALKLFETISPVVEVNDDLKVTIVWELSATKQP